MWKKWENVTEEERERIAEIAKKYEEPIGKIAGMFQKGMSFPEIISSLEKENLMDDAQMQIENWNRRITNEISN